MYCQSTKQKSPIIEMFLENEVGGGVDPSRRKKKGSSFCVACQKGFRSAPLYRRHLRLAHPPPASWACPLCPKQFRIKSSLARHLGGHSGERPFVCSLCQRGYSRRSVLALHVQQVHECRKPFQCDACGLRFSQKGNLRAHHRRKHGPIPPQHKPPKCKEEPHWAQEEPLQCKEELPPFKKEPSWEEEEEPLVDLDALLQLGEGGLLPPWTGEPR
ncbi:hypothetical protein JTE90_007365 [Oedothorax gibbosus]|uniref:C2H2-type domain-containing protein n=1 Tax=Oedothorax gibbosus TaxID=931172 RepID=A0AAV6U6P9_9ARAC|nr:hypothetical protein JTE90_007365 [Oedothorax gibbosus]